MNYLEQEKSPYLRQHMDNPVQWRPWGDEAFAAARAEDKPVFLSIGYATCHWCHVMAHESFEDEAVAAQINRDYVPVKVDREERPDVDSVYMAACVAMNGSGGWPLTVLLAPDQTPFWVGTYLPRAALLQLLAEAARLWREDRPALLQTGARLTAYLREAESLQPAQPDAALLHRGVQAFLRSFDRQWGGFGAAPKFPMPHNLVFLLHYGVQERDSNSIRAATETLEAMHRGGIFDHIGGGFSRYATDRQWLVPHFEKMLYDNALLLWAYTEGCRLLRRSDFGEVARRTAEYVLRELTDPDGGFYCGQDADSEGEEGKYYLLTPEELEPVLGAADAAAFCRWYDITTSGNFEGKSIPNRIGGEGEAPAGLDALRRRVLDYRRARLPLGLDDKVLTAWNGLMIAALARAGLYLSEPRYLEAARRSWEFLAEKLMDSETKLLARWRDGEAAHPGKLEDYAFLLWGALELYAVCFDAALLAQAVRLGEQLLEEFFDAAEGGFYPYAAHGEQLIARRKDPYDGAMPSGNAVAALGLLRLFHLTGELRWRDAAERQLAYLAGATQQAPSAHGFALLALLESLAPSTELVCVSAGTETPAALLNFLRESHASGLSVLLKTPATAETLAQVAPFTADYPIPAAGTLYYFCQNGSCRAPVSEPVLPQ